MAGRTNGEESESLVSRGKAMHPKTRQLELALSVWDEVPEDQRSGDAGRATHADERSGSKGLLMEQAVARENAIEALERVRRNKGSPDIDGMTELTPYLHSRRLTSRPRGASPSEPLALRDTPLQLRSPPAAARVAFAVRRERIFVRRNRIPWPAIARRMSDYLEDAALEHWAAIRLLYDRFADKRPVILFDVQEQRLYAYPYVDFRKELNARSQRSLKLQYERANRDGQVVVFVRDNEQRRLVSFAIDL
jgi:hypothetical protein